MRNIEFPYCFFNSLNTNKNNELFVDNSSKALNLFFPDLVCNMNFVKHILRPLFDDSNMWVFRVEYIVTYYTYRAIERLKNYCDNNIDMCIDLGGVTETLGSAKKLFQSKFPAFSVTQTLIKSFIYDHRRPGSPQNSQKINKKINKAAPEPQCLLQPGNRPGLSPDRY